MVNKNYKKLFTLTVETEIKMNCIAIEVFTLSWNQNDY